MTDRVAARLRWRCRRGMKELDLLLGDWLERRWRDAQPATRANFEWLLEQPDPDLADWLLHGCRPANSSHAALIDDILRCRT